MICAFQSEVRADRALILNRPRREAPFVAASRSIACAPASSDGIGSDAALAV